MKETLAALRSLPKKLENRDQRDGRNIITRNIIPLMLLAAITIMAILSIPLSKGYAGRYSEDTAFSCGTNCSGGYELSGHNSTYCESHPIECYNTIDECPDGNDPSYEYVEDLYVEDEEHDYYSGRDTLLVDAYVDCDSSGDDISFVYSNGSGFKVFNTTTCSTPGFVHWDTYLELDDVEGNHTVRAVIAYDGVDNMTCGNQSSQPQWSDTDDISFPVSAVPEHDPPQVTDPTPPAGTSYELVDSLEAFLCINVSDSNALQSVGARIDYLNYSHYMPLYQYLGPQYCDAYTTPEYLIRYNVTFLVEDEFDNLNDSVTTYFTVKQTGNLTIDYPQYDQVIPYAANGITNDLNFTLLRYVPEPTFYYSIDYDPNTPFSASSMYEGFDIEDSGGGIGEDTSSLPNISMSFKLGENRTIDKIGLVIAKYGNGSQGASVEILTDGAGEPNQSLATGTINSSATSNYSMVNFTLSGNITLNENTTYWISFLTSNSTASDQYSWEYNDDGNYSEGSSQHNASRDMLFRIYDALSYTSMLPQTSKGGHSILIAVFSPTGELDSPRITFNTDSTAPTIQSYSYTPSDNDSLDPGQEVNLTFNITDEDIIQDVSLQYYVPDEVNTTQISLTSNGTVYTATLDSNATGIHNITISATDRSNNSMSFSLILNMSYEKEWTLTPTSIHTTSTTLNTNISIANFTINNTGDFPVSIRFYKDESSLLDAYLNGTPIPYDLDFEPKGGAVLELVITGTLVESSYDMYINILDLNFTDGIGEPEVREVPFTFVTYASGPYLDLEITNYDASVTQGQTRVLLTTTLRNLGNATANNITLQSELPPGWNVTNGSSITKQYDTLGAGQEVTYSEYVNIGDDATTGNQTLAFRVNSTEGVNASASKAVTVNSQSESQDASPAALISSGSGGGGGPAAATYEPKEVLVIEAPDEVEITRGGNATLAGTLTNTGNAASGNITLVLEGYPALHKAVTPGYFESIQPNESVAFEVFIDAPLYMGSQLISSRIKAATGKSNAFTKGLAIAIASIEKNTSLECISKAGGMLSRMESLGIPNSILSEKLALATREYSQKDYQSADSLCAEITGTAEDALKVNSEIAGMRQSELAGSIPEFNNLIGLAEEALQKENYILAGRRAEQASLLAVAKQKEVQQAINTRISWAWRNAPLLIALAALSGIMAFFAFSFESMRDLARQAEELDAEERMTIDRIRAAQEKYFIQKECPKRLYEEEMGHCNEKLAGIEAKRNRIELKRLRAIRRMTLSDLARRKAQNEESIRSIQRMYYLNKAIGRKMYIKLKESYEKISIEIESEMEKRSSLKPPEAS